MPYVAGIDLGTSSVKCLILDLTTHASWVGQKDYQYDIPSIGYAEQDPHVWWNASKDALKEALLKAAIGADCIEAISFSGQMHGLVLLDEANQPVRPAIIWCDQRSSEVVSKVNSTISPDFFRKTSCNRLNTGFALASFIWLAENEPDNYAKIRNWGCPKDYVRFCLTNQWGMEQTDASSTCIYDVTKGEWSAEIISVFHLPGDIFPRVALPEEFAGYISRSAHEQTGLSQNCAVFFGASDQVMQAVGNGIVKPGAVSMTIGTGGQILTVLDSPLVHPSLRAHTFSFVNQRSWYFLGATLAAGQSLRWLKNNVLEMGSYEEMNELAQEKECGSEGLIFLPYLIGERSPHLDPCASGTFWGLRMKHDRGNLIRSVMEGVVYSLKDCMGLLQEIGVSPRFLVASGGGATSTLWMQIAADVLELPIYRSTTSEQAALGASMVAAAGLGATPSLEDLAHQLVRWEETPVVPNEKRFEQYRELYALYREIYVKNRDLMKKYYR